MAILVTGNTFSNGDQVTATKLNASVNSATFHADAVDGSTTQLSSGSIIVKDGGIVPAKLSTGGPEWTSGGTVSLKGDLWFTNDNPELLGGDSDGIMYISASATKSLGGNINLYGSSHGSAANDIVMRAGTTMAVWYDDSASKWDFRANAISTSGAITAAGTSVFTNLNISGAVDIDGAVQIDGAVTVGVNDTGHDVKFFGDTSGAYIQFDASADKLLTAGGATVDIVKDKLLIGGTAVTTTAAELNILDGVTSTAAELNILDGVTSTAAELNYNDTGAAVGTVVASKTVTVDANKDVSGFRNITVNKIALTGTKQIENEDENSAISVQGGVTGGAFSYWYGGSHGSQPNFKENLAATTTWFAIDGSTERMRLNSTGLGIGTESPDEKLDVVGAGRFSTGVTFGTDTAAANKLDDYEEGTWTPTISFGGASVDVEYDLQVGTYTKIGDLVTASCYMDLADKGTSTGAAVLAGLPVASRSLTGNLAAAALRLSNISFADTPMGYNMSNTTQINLQESTNAGTTTNLTEANFSDTSQIMMSVSYRV